MRLNRADHEAEKLLQELDGLQSGQHSDSGQQIVIQSGVQAGDDSSRAEPPALIDQAVLNMARRELQQPPPPIAGKLRWIAGVATVSVALIALGISLVQSPQAPGPADFPVKSKGIELESPRKESTETLQPPATSRYRATSQAADEAAPAGTGAAEAWLDRIQQLHDQGLHSEAREQLQSFVHDYPGFPLPDWAMRLQQQQP